MSDAREKIKNRTNMFNLIVGAVLLALLVYCVLWNPFNLDFSNFSFSDFVALTISLFAVVMSLAFYMNSTDTSSEFYHRFYDFSQNANYILGKIEKSQDNLQDNFGKLYDKSMSHEYPGQYKVPEIPKENGGKMLADETPNIKNSSDGEVVVNKEDEVLKEKYKQLISVDKDGFLKYVKSLLPDFEKVQNEMSDDIDGLFKEYSVEKEMFRAYSVLLLLKINEESKLRYKINDDVYDLMESGMGVKEAFGLDKDHIKTIIFNCLIEKIMELLKSQSIKSSDVEQMDTGEFHVMLQGNVLHFLPTNYQGILKLYGYYDHDRREFRLNRLNWMKNVLVNRL
jgi:hypothetical protein